MEKLTHYFKEQEDPFFQKGQRLGFTLGLESGKNEGLEVGKSERLKEGLEEGKKKGKRLIILNLLTQTSFSVAEIAQLADVSDSFVEEIKKEMGA